MAEGNQEGDNWWGQAGWGSWVKTVQEKSGNAWEQMRKDLGEFSHTIQRDTAQAAASTANIIKDQLKVAEEEEESVTTTARMKVGFSKLLTGLSQSLTPGEGGAGREDEVVAPTHKDPHIFDKVRARLHAMQTDPETYCTDPDGHPEFRVWLERFNVDTHKGEISELLVVNTEVRALYTKLVPAAVSHVEFWGRYFYRVQQLKEDEDRRRALKQRADMTSSQKFEDDEDLGWGDEDESYDTLPDASRNQSGTERFVVLPETTETEHVDRIEKPHQSKPEKSQQSESRLPTTDTVTGAKSSEGKDTSQTVTSAAISRNLDQSEQLKSTDQGPEFESKQELERTEQSSSKSDSVASQHEPQTPPEPSTTAKQVSSKSDVDSVPGESSADEVVVKAASVCVDSQEEEVKDKEADPKENLRLEGLTVEMVSEGGQAVEEAKAAQVSPVASESSNRESSLSDDWEKDFDDIEVTEEDMKNASVKLAKGDDDDDLDEDWESWE